MASAAASPLVAGVFMLRPESGSFCARLRLLLLLGLGGLFVAIIEDDDPAWLLVLGTACAGGACRCSSRQRVINVVILVYVSDGGLISQRLAHCTREFWLECIKREWQ